MSKIPYTPFAQLSDSTIQSIANATLAYPVTFNTQDEIYRITHSTSVNPSRITIPIGGVYNIFFSAIADSTSGTNKQLDMWLAVDGSNVAGTNTIVRIPTSSLEMIVSVGFCYTFTAGQYFEIMWAGSDTTVRLLATGTQANPTRPACPSIILTVFKLSSAHD